MANSIKQVQDRMRELSEIYSAVMKEQYNGMMELNYRLFPRTNLPPLTKKQKFKIWFNRHLNIKRRIHNYIHRDCDRY